MPNVWFYTIASVLGVSFVSVIGILALSLGEKKLQKILLFLVSFAAGALLADAFIHLLPEMVRKSGFGLNISLYLLFGILVFFILEKFIYWRHCHIPTSKIHPHPIALMNLVGDGMHNLVDGMIIAGSYLVSIPVGIATTVAVLLHEIPQEIGDFGILVYGGYTKFKAVMFNLFSGLLAVIGAVIILAIDINLENISTFIIPFTVGGFVYIAGSDLIPELKKETDFMNSLLQLIAFLFGIFIMYLLIFID
jgi:zinc and cadmium transporter